MIATPPVETIPLRTDSTGTIFVGNSRVTLQSVIMRFEGGDAPEKIVDSFDVLTLPEVYAVIAYYLNNREQIERYLQDQQDKAERLRQQLEAEHPEIFTLQEKFRALKSTSEQKS
jgi:uncharacterized protein (DUF433 family)